MKNMITTKGKKCLAPKGTVNEMEVSHLVSLGSHFGCFMFSNPDSPVHVLYHEMETPALLSQGF